ncbi:MAG: ribosome recycling factor [Elusimicrobia bacterium]|jgi:ribosome recycling factor|nr:ribosome recycling factor [Elusimicrobiota bacterium]
MANISPVVQPAFKDAEDKMRKSLERMAQEFSSVRSGRATGNLLDHIKVDYYGSMTPMKQVAAVSVPDGRTIEIKPWDAGALPAIERAIATSDLKLTPNNDGKMIRLVIPTLTEDRRKEMVKVVRKLAEEFRVAIRNDRRDVMEIVKKAEKDKLMTEDDRKTSEGALQVLTDSFISRVDDTLANKEKEILTV